MEAAARRLRALGLAPPAPPAQSKHTTRPQHQNGNTFGVALNLVSQKTVCCCGSHMQIPVIVYDACNMLKSYTSVEGIFRKAGSQSRQRDIKRVLDSGGKIDKTYHAIDIASILKLYLRSLPEPLITQDMQELLLRCLLLSETDHLCAIQLALLFMPISHLHVLHYILEFFKYVSTKSDLNKMDSNNLAIVLAPTIMPPPLTCPPQRMEHHVKLVKFLIENANIIGIVPKDLSLEADEIEKDDARKKKKRRSGSLTRMFTGLRKMVTSNTKPSNPDILATPVLDKGLNKRKQLDAQGFSAKKRKEILENLPSTPHLSNAGKEHKKLRLSIGRKSKEKYLSDKNHQDKNKKSKKSHENIILDVLSSEVDVKSDLSSDLMEIDLSNNKDNDYVRIPKSEYEAIKNRVSAIENRISQEFNVMGSIDHNAVEPVKQVQSAYEKTLEEAAILSSPSSEKLAKRMSKELKIRQSEEHKIIRSPSARKIGTIRRRSRENITRLTRTQTWTVSSQPSLQQSYASDRNQFYGSASLKRGRPNTVNTGLQHPNVILSNSSDVQSPIESKRRGSFHDFKSQQMSKIPVNHGCLTRNPVKRPSSFHGLGDVETPNKINMQSSQAFNKDFNKNDQWKSAESFLTNSECSQNLLTGRASVAKLRSQMAGMVLAKARLFDGMTDSDTSLEKRVITKPKQAQSFARKSRKCHSQDVHDSSTESNLSSEIKNLKSNYYKSPGYVSKRHKSKVIKSPTINVKSKDHLNLSSNLKDVIYDICTPLSEKNHLYSENQSVGKIKESNKINGAFKSPRATPNIKKSLNPKTISSFKMASNVSTEAKKLNTPVRANHVTPRRQSPRLISMKARQLV